MNNTQIIENELPMNVITHIEVKDNKLFIEKDGTYHLFLYLKDLRKKAFKDIIVLERALTDEELCFLEEYVVTRGKRRIMYLLEKQDYPESALRVKLQKSGYNTSHIDRILSAFVEKGFVNDQSLIQRKIDAYKSFRSKREIEYKLSQNGFSTDDIKEAVRIKLCEEDEYISAMKLMEKQFHLKQYKLEKDELKKKALGYLSRKGYSIQVCLKVFDAFCEKRTDNF